MGQFPLDTIDISIKPLRIKEDEGMNREMDKANFQITEDGMVWIASEDGVFRYDGYHAHNFSAYLIEKYPSTFNAKGIYWMHIDQKRTLWMATRQGLYAYNLNSKKGEHVFLDSPMYDNNYRNKVRQVKQFDSTTLSVYTCNGLYLVDLTTWAVKDKMLTKGSEKGVRRNTTSRIYSYVPNPEKDSFYVVLPLGLEILDKKTRQGRTVKSKYIVDDAHWLYDPFRYKDYLIFHSYGHGFTYFNLNTKQFEKPALMHPTGRWAHVYNAIKGYGKTSDSTLLFVNENFNLGTINLNTREVNISKKVSNLANASLVDSFGYFWVASHFDFYRTPKPTIPNKKGKHYLSIYKIISNNKLVSYPYNENYETCELADDQRNLSLHFALSFQDYVDSLRFEYRIDEGEWKELGNTNSVFLNYGLDNEIQLEIRAYDTDKLLDSISYTIHWNIPFYKKWTYQLAGLLLLIIALIYFYRLRISRLKKQQDIRLEYERQIAHLESMALRSQMNPHFMFNSINSIKGLIINEAAEAAADQLTKFSKLMRSTLNYSAEKIISLEREVEFITLYAELERFKGKFPANLNFEIDPAIDMEATTIIPFLIQPFVENAFKHAFNNMGDRQAQIDIRFKKENNILVIFIEDNGIGVKDASATVHVSKGTSLVEKRLELHNKRKDNVSIIFRGENKGTLVTLKIVYY